ncbi:MAG TPA: hypothetical protein VLH58_00985 [Candidatus Methylomirabilis sp.]|nr:hypothetical protein [Candidatus Methylomirabilis sp.]
MGRASSQLGVALIVFVGWAASVAVAEAGTTAGASQQGALPLSEVVLYTSGVGYFQRNGVVDGRSRVELRFKTERVNDLLKSLVVQDLDGGQISAVTYDSRDPITKTLKTFSVDLTRNLSLGDLLERIRGEEIEVTTPNPLRGVILGVEKKKERVGDKEVVEAEYLNLLTADGLRSVSLTQVQRVQIVSQQLRAELQQALGVLASGHDAQKKTVQLEFDGEGRRRVRVAYIDEAPVWKTSYRLALSDTQRPFLQGWAIVENTTDDDWENVRLSLISGRPISFTMDLYEPLYVKRPVVVSELYEALRPQVYDQTLGEARQLAAPRATAVMPAAPGAAGPMARYAPPAAAMAPAPSAVPLHQGVTSAAQAAAAGELFQYTIKAPLTLARLKSAMIPIVNEEVEGAKVSIYNQRVNDRYPLSGFRLKNSSALHLLQGPITVYDAGIYAGDARIADLPTGQERLISYALDLKTEVEAQSPAAQDNVVTAALRKGTLTVTRKSVADLTYTVVNRDTKRKTVLIEHPFRADWTLVAPAAVTERTRDVYRFTVPVEANGKAQLHVREERLDKEIVGLSGSSPVDVGIYLESKQVSAKVKDALKRMIALRDRLDRTGTQRSGLEQRIREISEEQGRIRENMANLAQNSELYTRYVGKLDQQETEIEGIRKEVEALKAAEVQQRRELTDYLLGLEIE